MKTEILIIHNNNYISEFISKTLGNKNYKLTIVDSHISVLNLIETKRFNLAFVQSNILETNDFEILQKIRKIYNQSELPIIAVCDLIEEIDKALEFGANDFITMPFTEKSLQVKVKNLLQLQKSNQELQQIKQQQNDIFEFSPVASVLVDEKGIIKEINKAAYQLFKINKNTIIPVLLGELFDCYNAIKNKGKCGTMPVCFDCVVRSLHNDLCKPKKNIIRQEGW